MGLNFHVPLPGPFSYSARVTPNLKPLGRAVSKTIAAERRRGHSCDCSHGTRPPVRRPEVPQYYRPVKPSAIPPTPRSVEIALWVVVAVLGLATLVLFGAMLMR